MIKNHLHLIILLFLLLTISCSEQPTLIVKALPSDPFQKTIVKSQFHKIDAKKDTVVEGSKGTILVFQKGSFLDAAGDPVEDNIDIELAEALTLADMLLSNLTTTSGDQILETGGMIYFNATSAGEQLFVNPDKPVHIEIPTKIRKPNMQVFTGFRDSIGHMNWVNPEPMENFLNPVDIFALDLLPNGFDEAVEKEMPFRNYKIANKTLIDSLYYSLYFTDASDILEEQEANLNVRERYDNGGFIQTELDSLSENAIWHRGVDPAIIKALKNSAFQNTLIATKEFRARLQVMFKICRTDVIDIYTRNLDKNLWELDSIALSILDDNLHQNDFKDFANEKWTIVKNSDINTELLKDFYTKRLIKIKGDLSAIRNKVVKANNEKTASAKKIVAKYQNLLNKREAYRMTSYGFQRTITGWINIDRGIAEKNWEYQPFEIVLSDSTNYDRAYAYIVYESMKSLYRLNSNDKKIFYVGNAQRREMITPKNSDAKAIIIAYIDNLMFVNAKQYKTNSLKEVQFDSLLQISETEFKSELAKYEDFLPENSVLQDLEYAEKIYEEKRRQDTLLQERFVMWQLRKVAFPSDTTFLRYSREWAIDMPVDSCVNQIRKGDEWN